MSWTSLLDGRMRPAGNSLFDSGASARRLDHGLFEADDLPGCADWLLGYRLAGEVRAERKLDGRWQRAETRPGSITIMSPGRVSSWRLIGSGRMLHVYLPPAVFDAVLGHEAPAAVDIRELMGAEDPAIGALLEAFAREMDGAEIGSRLLAESLLVQVTVALVRRHSTLAGRTRPDGTRLGEPTRRAIVDFIEAHLGREIALGELAGMAALGLSQFNRNFRATFGMPPYRYVLSRRVARAQALLADPRASIVDVALLTGFAHQAHLTTTFKRFSGDTPAAFRNRRRP